MPQHLLFNINSNNVQSITNSAIQIKRSVWITDSGADLNAFQHDPDLIQNQIKRHAAQLIVKPDKASLAEHLVHPEDYLHSGWNIIPSTENKGSAPEINYSTSSVKKPFIEQVRHSSVGVCAGLMCVVHSAVTSTSQAVLE